VHFSVAVRAATEFFFTTGGVGTLRFAMDLDCPTMTDRVRNLLMNSSRSASRNSHALDRELIWAEAVKTRIREERRACC